MSDYPILRPQYARYDADDTYELYYDLAELNLRPSTLRRIARGTQSLNEHA